MNKSLAEVQDEFFSGMFGQKKTEFGKIDIGLRKPFDVSKKKGVCHQCQVQLKGGDLCGNCAGEPYGQRN